MYCKMTREQRLNFVMSSDLFASHSLKIASLLCGFSSKSLGLVAGYSAVAHNVLFDFTAFCLIIDFLSLLT